jgi:hypothetical protein
MWVEFIEIFMEKVWPAKWEDYQRARYDYEDYISREDVKDMRGGEIWCRCPGKRVRMVEVVVQDGKRLRVRDDD